MKKVFLSIFCILFLCQGIWGGFVFRTGVDAIRIEKLAELINETLRKPSLKNREICVLTFVDLNDLEQTTPLGRFLQERLSFHLFKLGFRILEIRLGKQIYFHPKTGELNLSRLKEKMKATTFQDVKSIVVGTYIDAGKDLYVNSKLVEVETALVRASGEIRIRKTKHLEKLFKAQDKKKDLENEIYERHPLPEKEAE